MFGLNPSIIRHMIRAVYAPPQKPTGNGICNAFVMPFVVRLLCGSSIIDAALFASIVRTIGTIGLWKPPLKGGIWQNTKRP